MRDDQSKPDIRAGEDKSPIIDVNKAKKIGADILSDNRAGHKQQFKSVEEVSNMLKNDYTKEKIKQRAASQPFVYNIGDPSSTAFQLCTIIGSIPITQTIQLRWRNLLIAKIRLSEWAKINNKEITGDEILYVITKTLNSQGERLRLRDVAEEELRALDWVENYLTVRQMVNVADILKEKKKRAS